MVSCAWLDGRWWIRKCLNGILTRESDHGSLLSRHLLAFVSAVHNIIDHYRSLIVRSGIILLQEVVFFSSSLGFSVLLDIDTKLHNLSVIHQVVILELLL